MAEEQFNATISEDIEQARESTYEEELAAARERRAAKEQRKAAHAARFEVQEEIEGNWFTNLFRNSEEGELEDDGWVDNTAEIVLSGGEIAIEQVVRTLGDVSSSFDKNEDSGFASARISLGDKEFLQSPEGEQYGIPVWPGKRLAVLSGAEFKHASAVYEIATGRQPATLSSFEIPDQDRPDSAAGQMAQAFLQFGIVFAATRRSIGPRATTGGQIAAGAGAGAVADFSAFDPHEERLSNMLVRFGTEGDDWYDPIMANAVTEYLAADELDSALEGRLKNAIEGTFLGGMVEGVFMSIKWLRYRGQARKFNAIPDDVDTVIDDVVDDVVEPSPFDDLDIEVEGNTTTVRARLNEPRAQGEFGLGMDEAGKIQLVSRGGETLQVIDSIVETASREQGNGSKLYAEAARIADEQGLILTSDTSVTGDAAAVWERMKAAGDDIVDLRETEPDAVTVTKEVLEDGSEKITYGSSPGKPIFTRRAGAQADEASNLVDDVVPASKKATEADVEDVLREDLGKTKVEAELEKNFRLNTDLPEATIENLARAINEGNFAEAGKLVNFNDAKFDWENMADGDNIKQLLIAFENAIDPMIKEATGGRVPLAQTKRIGQLIGASAQEAMNLFGELKGKGGISARMFAAHQAMTASGGRLVQLAKLAKESGSPEDLFNYHRHIEMHAALMATIKGSQTEIARALSAMRLMKDAAADSFKQFEEAKRLMKGHANSERLIDDLLINRRDLKGINTHVLRSTGRKISDIIAEVAINGLLSSPKTHLINFTSNAAMTILGPFERYIAAGVGALRGRDAARMFREANAALMGQLSGTISAARIAGRAFVEGKPISDLRQRVEFDARKQITAGTGDNLFTRGGPDTVLQKAVNTLGDIIRIPGRLLITGDEFFKTVAKQGELAAQGYRKAAASADMRKFKAGNGMTAAQRKAQWIKNEMRRLVKDPDPDMEAHAIEHARKQTFQETPQTGFGGKVEALLNFHPFVKLVVAPFVRTPLNLLRQAFVDRNPALAFFVKKNRELLRAGGREGDEVIARTVSGVGLMVTAYGLAEGGLITGKGERYTNTEKLDKIPEYSLKIGDRYFQFNRVDPVGSILGLVADIHYAMNHVDMNDPNALPQLQEFSQAVGLAYMTGAMNKTWMRSLSDIMETATRTTEGSGPTAKRAAKQFAADNLFKLVPFSSALRGTAQSIDPVVREAWTIRDRIFKNLPGLSDNLPPARDLLGREITRENAHWFWINPFGANPESDNPVDQELAKLEFEATVLPKDINGVVLNSIQYSRIKELMGKLGEDDPGLETILRDLFADPDWQNVPTDYARTQIVKDILQGRRDAAKAIFTSEDEDFRKATLEHTALEASRMSGADLEALRLELGLTPQ